MNIILLLNFYFYVYLIYGYDNETSKIVWPHNSFAIPEPISGCPTSGNWLSGSVYQNTEDDMNTNSHSKSYHMKGRFDDHGIEIRFCVHDNDDTSEYTWPNGSYCFYKYKICPKHFKEGEIYWQDEKKSIQIPNRNEGALPDGAYNLTSTMIKFCCIDNMDPNIPIVLPIEDSFYLFPMKKECQQVKNMEVTKEWIHFDDDDEGNTDYASGSVPYGVDPKEDYNINLQLCYYEEKKSEKREIGLKMKEDSEPKNTNHRKMIFGAVISSGLVLVLTITGAVVYKLKLMKIL